MEEPALVFVTDGTDGFELVVNFAVYGGREATPAEIDRLGDALLEQVGGAEVVSETRYRFDPGHRASVYQVRVVVDGGLSRAALEPLRAAVEAWAQECISERRVMTP